MKVVYMVWHYVGDDEYDLIESFFEASEAELLTKGLNMFIRDDDVNEHYEIRAIEVTE